VPSLVSGVWIAYTYISCMRTLRSLSHRPAADTQGWGRAMRVKLKTHST
jgi:hypothetical protein